MVFVGILLSVLLFGGMGTAVFLVLKKMNGTNPDTSVNDNIKTAQEFLPFEDIRDNMIVLGGYHYRAVIECSSINYDLKTNNEKEMIEASFQRFVNSLASMITIFIQTRVIDNSKVLREHEEHLAKTLEIYPQLKEYAETYLNELSNVNLRIGNNKEKRKYLIFAYDDAVTLSNLSDDEKYDYAQKELQNRCSILLNALNTMGIKGKILETKDLTELIYATYHKGNYANADYLNKDEFLSLLTQNKTSVLRRMDTDAFLDLILCEAKKQISVNLLSPDLPDFLRDNCEKIIHDLDEIRNKYAGYYKNGDCQLTGLSQKYQKEEEALNEIIS